MSEYRNIKAIIIGSSGTGKTNIIKAAIDEPFEEDNKSTLTSSFVSKNIKIEKKTYHLDLWDTAGQERFKSLAKNIIRNADGIILIYDMSNYNFFKAIKTWINIIEDSIDITKIGIIIVGSKCDLTENEIKVDKEIKDDFEKEHNMKIIEASAKNSINVNDTFLVLIKKMIELDLGKNKSDDDDYEPIKLRISRTRNERYNNICCGFGNK